MDIRILELLSARMCHDLISPVSAIGNGVELVTEFDDQMQGEALALIGESAQAASRLLQFYRAALGSARASDGSPLGLREARLRTLEALGNGRIHINWPEPGGVPDRQVSRLGVKLLMSLVLVASDLLPGTGEIIVGDRQEGEGIAAEVSAVKSGFTLSNEDRDAITRGTASDDLTPRTVVAYYCGALAETLGHPLVLVERADGVTVRAFLPFGEMA